MSLPLEPISAALHPGPLPDGEGALAPATSSSPEDIERAFRLAYFIRPDRRAAIRVTVEALSHLDDLIKEQDRRRYSRPCGHRTKVSLSRCQLLQQLVCCVAESSATEGRRAETASGIADDLLIRFVVYLVRIATRRSSFYVNLAVSRILHDYSTAEAMAIYDLLTQDPERMRADSYFRYGKGLLTKEMRRRFGAWVRATRVARGEIRLCGRRPTQHQAALVGECLRLATPWATRCPWPESFDRWRDPLPELCFKGDHPDGEHPVDMRRTHTILHPECYLAATRALGLDAPAERLRVPRFSTGGLGHPARREARRASNVLTGRRPRALREEEVTWIVTELEVIARRRRRWTIRRLSI